MSYRDDFSSNMNSPGNYSASGNWGGNNASGNMGGNSGTFGGSNNPGSGFQTISQVQHANAGGGFGPGSSFGSGGSGGMGGIMSLLGSLFGPQPQTPYPGTAGPVDRWVQQVNLPPPTATPRPPVPASYRPRPGALSWPPGSMGHGSTWGGRPVPVNTPGTAPQGSYTRPPGASFGMGMSGYGSMGNDFRSNNFSPASYPGGDGITGNDIGGGWR